jgi:hypothetical protein
LRCKNEGERKNTQISFHISCFPIERIAERRLRTAATVVI